MYFFSPKYCKVANSELLLAANPGWDKYEACVEVSQLQLHLVKTKVVTRL